MVVDGCCAWTGWGAFGIRVPATLTVLKHAAAPQFFTSDRWCLVPAFSTGRVQGDTLGYVTHHLSPLHRLPPACTANPGCSHGGWDWFRLPEEMRIVQLVWLSPPHICADSTARLLGPPPNIYYPTEGKSSSSLANVDCCPVVYRVRIHRPRGQCSYDTPSKRLL